VSEQHLLGSAWDCHCGAEGVNKCPSCVCKELQRERDEARVALREVHEQLEGDTWAGYATRMKRERDEARSERDALQKRLDTLGLVWNLPETLTDDAS
jgi:hypothetical protein